MDISCPIVDLHCDLLSYLVYNKEASYHEDEAIGCGLPNLKKGGVGLQVMAIFTTTQPGSAYLAMAQSVAYKKLIKSPDFENVNSGKQLAEVAKKGPKVGVMVAVENASGLCEEGEHFKAALMRLDYIMQNAGHICYITLTHHTENRFGGGNYSKVGLKEDGKLLLDYINESGIAVDLSHTSDATAHDILNHIDRLGLNIPVMASHSNFRHVCGHVRNLPDELAKEVIAREGLIGINFLRAFVDDDQPEKLVEHLLHGLELGGENALAFGADFFDTAMHPDQTRKPFYFPEHANASCYPGILAAFANAGVTPDQLEKICWTNFAKFTSKFWGTPA